MPIKKILHAIIALALPMLYLVITESVIRGSLGAFLFWLQHVPPAAAAVNYLCYFTLVHITQFIRRRGPYWAAQFSTASLLIIFAFISRGKTILRMEPVLPGDIRLIPEALNIAISLFPQVRYMLPIVTVFIIAVCVLLCLRYYKKERRPSRGLFALALTALACMVLYIASGAEAFPRSAARQVYRVHYSLYVNAEKNGTAFHLLEYAADHHERVSPPDGYHPDAIDALMPLPPASRPTVKPHVIILLGESMADVYCIEELALAEDPMPNLRALMAQGVSGIARVQSFGGGTHLAESALISGLHTNPYIPHKMDSLAWQLKPLGYQSTAVHTYWGWFYDRHKHMKDLGFDRFIPLEAMTGRPDFIPYAGDRLLYDQILGVLSESQSPHFIYAATMQAHGGYAYPARYDTPVQSVPLPPDAERELQNFLWQLTSADAALGDFVRGLQHLEEPFVLIFLADHFPSLPLTLAAAGIDKEDERLYEMPYCVITNTGTALPEFGMLEDTQLSALALGALGLPETIYQRYADDEQAFNLLTYDALYGMQYARDRITQGDDNAAYLFGREPIISRALVNGNELTLIGTDLTWRTVIQCGRAYELVLFDTNGQTATACVTDAMAAEMRLSQARILFVDDAERPFYETIFHAVFSDD